MSRAMPTECPHGAIIDWGDFGGPDAQPEPCAECDHDHLWEHDTYFIREWVNGQGAPTVALREQLASSLVGRCDTGDQAIQVVLDAIRAATSVEDTP